MERARARLPHEIPERVPLRLGAYDLVEVGETDHLAGFRIRDDKHMVRVGSRPGTSPRRAIRPLPRRTATPPNSPPRWGRSWKSSAATTRVGGTGAATANGMEGWVPVSTLEERIY
jgi:anti-sigma factor RsiW